MKTSQTERDRLSRLSILWRERPEGKRTETDVLPFYTELERAHPELLPRGQGDAYQALMADLMQMGLILGSPKPAPQPESVEAFDEDQRKKLAVWAVNELIADAEAKRLVDDKSLAEVISACIRFTEARTLRDLKFLLEQRELEGRANFAQRREIQSPEQGGMDALPREILKLLSEHGQMHWGTVRNKLNGQPAGWDVSDRDVQGALDRLLKAGKVNRDDQDGDRWSLAKERYPN